MLLAKRVSSDWPKPLIASGITTPSMRYCTFAWSPRTCSWPYESCTTPGACSTTWFSGVDSPIGSASMSAVPNL